MRKSSTVSPWRGAAGHYAASPILLESESLLAVAMTAVRVGAVAVPLAVVRLGDGGEVDKFGTAVVPQ